jgi:hypothetical protein
VVDTRDAEAVRERAYSRCGKHRVAAGTRPSRRIAQGQNDPALLQWRHLVVASGVRAQDRRC